MKRPTAVLACIALSIAPLRAQPAPAPAPGDTRPLRFPATNGRQIVFSHADQPYSAGLAGGLARRLTNGPGYAVFPRFSPDGTEIAFTAQCDGNTEVYLMPAEGGTPRRLTHTATLDRDDLSDRMGPNNIVVGWTNTTGRIVFRSRTRSFDPDIVVDNDPAKEFAGVDQQLDRAVDEVLAELKTGAKPLPPPPPWPGRS